MRDNRNSSALSLISIYEISKILTSSLNLEKTLRDVVNVLSSYLEMRRGMVTLGAEGGKLEVVAAAGMTPETMRREGERLIPPLVAQVLAAGTPIVAHDAQEALAATGTDGGRTLDGEVVTLIGVPIRGAEKPVGVLTIERIRDAGRNDVNMEADVRFLTMVANLVAQTVRLHASVASERERLILEKHRLQKAATADLDAGPFNIDDVVGRSRRMREVYAEIHQVAPSRSTVLLRGESGTGKELVAKAVHHLSQRKSGPFIKVNCAALSESLLESELFGHEKGAFTGAQSERKGRFELANGGTLFLDEIGEVSGPFQAKLLRVLQEGEFERVGGNKTIKVDVRLVCATNRNLEEMVAKGDFRADLYYRINVVPIFLPPLRERKEDIPLLAEHFLARFNKENGREVKISEDALGVLRECNFPGNVRELENCIYRVATTLRGTVVDAESFPCHRNLCLSSALWNHGVVGAESLLAPEPVRGGRSHPPVAVPPPADFDGPRGDEEMEGGGLLDDLSDQQQRERLLRAMEKAGWVQAKAARLLNLTPRQIGYALKKHNIEVKRI